MNKLKRNARGRRWYWANHERSLQNGVRYRRKLGVLSRDSTELKAKQLSVLRRAYETNPRIRPGPQNVHSKPWYLRDPRGRAHHFVNLRDFVKKNPDLFTPDSVEWEIKKTGPSCKATRGLANLSPRRKRTKLSWKGWTWAATNSVSGPAHDILQRRAA